jgi:transposase
MQPFGLPGKEAFSRLGDMQDFQLYQQLLGLAEPWRVKQVTLNHKNREVLIEVECTETMWGCPTCSERMHVHDWERRCWRHLDSCQYKTIIQADVPRVKCAKDGTQTVAVPWAEKFGRFTRLFERLAIDLMRECSVVGACEILRISWDEADGIKQRAVKRGLERKAPGLPRNLCVDEKSAARGHDYLTIVANVDGERTTVEYVAEGRAQENLDAYWKKFGIDELAGVQAVGMDMWEPFISSTLAHVPGAQDKIVHDPFHLVKHMNEAVNDVRKQEHARLTKTGDDTLRGTRQLWLYGMENLSPSQALRFDQIKFLCLKTARAWGIKEMFRGFLCCLTVEEARTCFKEWYHHAIHSQLEPVKKVARMCKNRLRNILTYFEHRLTNGPIEGLNNKIQGLIKKAYGYRNKQRFIADIYFHLGGLNLYPANE